MKKPETFQPVSSSIISGFHYNSDEKNLYIKFHNGRVYCYFKVESSDVERLKSAESFGKEFKRSIEKGHPYSEV